MDLYNEKKMKKNILMLLNLGWQESAVAKSV